MLAALLFLTGSLRLAASAAAPVPSISVDLDGDGTAESVSAGLRRRKLRLEVRSASGKVLAAADAPAPAGSPSVAFTAGSLGSAGSLLEVVASSDAEECRSLWRFQQNVLSRVPLAGGAASSAPDCGAAGGWTYTWDRPSEEAPAEYRRERTRETTDGTHHQVESFRYAGFRLEIDPARSRSEIRGVAIPRWYPARLYRKGALDGLYGRFDLSPLRKGPRLQLLTEPAAGVFAIRIERPYGDWTLPVIARKPGDGPHEILLTVGAETDTPPKLARIALPGESVMPAEVVLTGFGAEIDGSYSPAIRVAAGGLRVYATAEEELALNGLVGRWSGARGEPLIILLASSDPVLLGIGKEQFRVEMEGAPEGSDALLIPRTGPNTAAITLRGPNAFERVPVRCENASAPARRCVAAGPPELVHRIGARMNAR